MKTGKNEREIDNVGDSGNGQEPPIAYLVHCQTWSDSDMDQGPNFARSSPAAALEIEEIEKVRQEQERSAAEMAYLKAELTRLREEDGTKERERKGERDHERW